MERFPHDVFPLVNLEIIDLDPLRYRAAQFSQAYYADAAGSFLCVCHAIFNSKLSWGRRLSLFFLWRDALSNDFGPLLIPKKMEAFVLSPGFGAWSSCRAWHFVRPLGPCT